jgi:hypothetical protein
MQLIYGVGINDRSVAATLNGKITKEYTLWHSMLKRCYSKPYLEEQPTYIGCSVSDNFKYYHLFHAWCQTQVGFGKEEYQLDKDLLIKGNKLYSEDTCVFIPSVLNYILLKTAAGRGLLPIGVTKHGKGFRAMCNIYGKAKPLGTFDTPELAFEVYKNFKEAHIKTQAEVYKHEIDERAYQALINYKVDIGD